MTPALLDDFVNFLSSRDWRTGITSTAVARSAIRNHQSGRNHSGGAWASSFETQQRNCNANRKGIACGRSVKSGIKRRPYNPNNRVTERLFTRQLGSRNRATPDSTPDIANGRKTRVTLPLENVPFKGRQSPNREVLKEDRVSCQHDQGISTLPRDLVVNFCLSLKF